LQQAKYTLIQTVKHSLKILQKNRLINHAIYIYATFTKTTRIVIMALDFTGNVVSAIQIAALILLVIGVYPYRIRTKNRNLIMHGFLSILALALNLATVFSVMIPVLTNNLALISNLSILQSAIVYLHFTLGTAAIILGFVIIVSWVTHPLGELGCSKTWRLMIPTFLIWAAALILGVIIHIYNIA
jgi:hypothetical protein